MKVLVTGATGFTGSRVVPLLLERGHAVRCLVRPSSDTSVLPAGRVELHAGDLGDGVSLTEALKDRDALVNIASLGFGHGPGIVSAAAASSARRAVFVSTTAIFTGLEARSKLVRLVAEDCIRSSGLDFTILRPTMIYGSARDRNMCRLIRYVGRWPIIPVFGDGRGLQQPVYVEDVARAAVRVLEEPGTVGKCYNLAGANALSFDQIIDTVAGLMKRRVLKVHIPSAPIVWLLAAAERLSVPLPIRAEQVLRLNEDKAFDYSEAARDFGFRPISFSQGIERELSALGLR
jgi:nucleoside-diphosphate-sugar epimerase